METSKISKAQALRDKQNTKYINSSLRLKLASFENKFLNNSVKYAIGEIEASIKHYNKLIQEFPTRVVTKSNQRDTVANYQYSIERAQNQLDNYSATITMKALNKAKKNYDERIDKLVNTLVQEGFGHAHYKIEMLKTRGSDLEFLISKSDKEVHARLIFVDGILVCPHFRFITTTRKVEYLKQ